MIEQAAQTTALEAVLALALEQPEHIQVPEVQQAQQGIVIEVEQAVERRASYKLAPEVAAAHQTNQLLP